ncbi:MAG: hypothetical protein ACO23R_18050 [bacterium]
MFLILQQVQDMLFLVLILWLLILLSTPKQLASQLQQQTQAQV